MANGNIEDFKTAIESTGRSAFARYRDVVYGPVSAGFALKAEILTALLGAMSGAAGLFLRRHFYRSLFDRVGRNVLIGRNVTFRHPRKIRLGDHVILDENCVLDAKGDGNEGITIGNRVFIGRDSLVYCKNGDIRLHDRVSVSSNCTMMSANRITVGEGTVIGGYSYLLSGGEYDYADVTTPFCEQRATRSKGELTVGRHSWLGARVTVLDAACIGDHCVIGAHSLVTRPIPPDTLAYGTPARAIRKISSLPA